MSRFKLIYFLVIFFIINTVIEKFSRVKVQNHFSDGRKFKLTWTKKYGAFEESIIMVNER